MCLLCQCFATDCVPVPLEHFRSIGQIPLWFPSIVFRRVTCPLDEVLVLGGISRIDTAVGYHGVHLVFLFFKEKFRWRRWLN